MRRKKKKASSALRDKNIHEAIQIHRSGNLDLAKKKYKNLLNVTPTNLVLLNNLAGILLQEANFEEGLELLNKSINILQSQPYILNSRGNILRHLERLDDALLDYERAIKFKPDYASAHSNRGGLLKDTGKFEEALESYNRAIILDSNNPNIYCSRATLLSELGRVEEANSDYNRTIYLKMDVDFAYGVFLLTKRQVCDWNNHNQFIGELIRTIKSNKNVTSPFPILSLVDDPLVQKMAIEKFTQSKYPSNTRLHPKQGDKYPRHDKIRIGYYSSDFYNHAISYLMASLFEQHDRSKFEIIAFSFGPDKNDEMKRRVSNAFDKFIDVSLKSDEEIINLSRSMEIDIAVDLKGYTLNMRLGVFAGRAAPVQVNYLGYPGTLAADYMDYIIADKILIPEASQDNYSEKIVYLPNSYQPNDPKKNISDKVFSRGDLGLPEDGFIFCSFNQSYKISPEIFDSWMRILKEVQGSVLWILEDKMVTILNLRKEAEKRGISADRLVFAKRMPLDEHLSRLQVADLFLDSHPYNAHTTCSDALWVGLPIITFTGEAFASRVSASLLSAAGLQELIMNDQSEYEDKAIDLANNFHKLEEIKLNLKKNVVSTPLFDIESYTKSLEKSFSIMYERHHDNVIVGNIEINENVQPSVSI